MEKEAQMTKVSLGATATTELPRSQQERRQRILDAATALASKGGYEAVQMRDVAERANVALGTLYRYFPSKVHLLLSLMHDQVVGLTSRLEKQPPAGATAADRVLVILTRASRALQRNPQLSDAMIRALMFADASAATEVNTVNSLMTEGIILAMRGPDRQASPDDHAVARVIEQVWWANILAWLSGRSSAKQMTEDLQVATRLLLR
jgi:TetR/AcrR family transcriptional regulator, cholesterol catabolism regulator